MTAGDRSLTFAAALNALLLAAAHPASGELSLALEDPLTSGSPVQGEAAKEVTAGQFVADGWQSNGSSSRIVITLSDGFAPNESDAVELDITNWDPVNQYTGAKHQFFDLYSRPEGNKSIFTTVGCWWNVRGGTNYMDGGGGFKFLWAPCGGASRGEVRLIQSRNDWDVSKTYTFRVEWTETEISILLDGNRLSGPNGFGGRQETLSYIFLGKDNVYGGFSGPVYKSLRVYAEGGGAQPQNEPPVLEPIGEKTVEEGEPLSFTVSAADPDGDGLTYSASGLPTGASFDAGSCTFSWTTESARVGSHRVTFAVSDGEGGADSETVTITVVPLDTDQDGMPDYWENEHGLDPSDESDAGADPDGDGLVNVEEYLAGADPRSPDTDGDGYLDGEDRDPAHPPGAFHGLGGGCGSTVSFPRTPKTGSSGRGAPRGGGEACAAAAVLALALFRRMADRSRASAMSALRGRICAPAACGLRVSGGCASGAPVKGENL